MALGLLTLTAAVAVGATPAGAAPGGDLAPLVPAGRGEPSGTYIVVLKPANQLGRTEDPVVTARRAGGTGLHRYAKVLSGFSGELPPAALAAVRAHPAVAYVQADAKVRAVEPAPAAGGAQAAPPSWGLDRIDQRTLPLDDRYDHGTTGAGATVFVVDSGIRATHADFGGQVRDGYDAVTGDGPGTSDCNGHGTHVAGTAAGATYGVAKDAEIRPVRVLDCAGWGWNSDLIEGLDWLAANAPARSIANISLGGYDSTLVNAAVERLIDAGVLVVFSAGNDNRDACANVPGSPRGVTVGASMINDVRWPGSNVGSCVDLFAPGAQITSAGIADDTAVARGWVGTSMAAPHVTGWLARYLQANPAATPAQAKSAVLAVATAGVLTDVGAGSPNLLLYAPAVSGTGDTAAPTRPGTPSASQVTVGSATLSWTASADDTAVAGYQIETAVGSGSFAPAGTAAAASFVLGKLAPATRYRVRVRAVDASGNLSAYSTAGAFTTPADYAAPTAPGRVSASELTATSLQLSWPPSTDNVGVTGYQVESKVVGGTFSAAGTAPTTQIVLSTLKPATSYLFRVRAVDARGNRSAYSNSEVVTTLPDTDAPTAPGIPGATQITSTSATLSWPASADNVGVTGYRIETRIAGTTTYAPAGTSAGTSFALTGLAPITPYQFRIQAVDAAGNLSPYSTPGIMLTKQAAA